ncbi:hypothetical protein HAX54_040234 [Datura stramonium]|uniref:Uncharacterized protein n=1 Tax=Datura stramonium TaxID=4076 RepID=A0ABS8SK43_DATST|nr:hypothetical protein [Datura stramonium]
MSLTNEYKKNSDVIVECEMTKEEEQLRNVQNQQGEKHDEDKDEEHQETDKMADEQNTNARDVKEIEDEESTSLPSGIKNLEPINLNIDLNWNRQTHEQNNEVREDTNNVKNKERIDDSSINGDNNTTNKITGKNNSFPEKSIGEEKADADQNDNENQKKAARRLRYQRYQQQEEV